MVQALMAAARFLPGLVRGAGAASKAAPTMARGAMGGLEKGGAKALTSGPRGVNELASEKPGGSSPMDMVGTAANLLGMGDMVKDLLPKDPNQQKGAA